MRDKLVTEPSEFEGKVEALVEQLGEEIAALANDGEEFENGIAIAAIALLDLSLGNDDIDDDEDMGWFGSLADNDDDLFSHSPDGTDARD